MTDKEKMVLEAILGGSNFNGTTINVAETWRENCKHLEGGYWAFADVKDYGCGMSKQATRAVFGSLYNKGLIDLVEEDDDITWIHIDEKQFKNIVKEYSRG